MKFALSTNWCSGRLDSGEAIVDEALALGFDALELGYRTTDEHVRGFRARLGEMPVGSVHAFCPVPISAPCAHPELYALASFDEQARAIARAHVLRNVAFAADMGADALVLHAGRVACRTILKRNRPKRRERRGRLLADVFRKELELVVPELERKGVSLGLENLPYLEGFPNETEMADVAGDWVRPWLDVGHAYVRSLNGWAKADGSDLPAPLGLHVSDSNGGDDHLAPGEGKIDFAALAPVATAARHVVVEPNPEVAADALRRGLALLRRLWDGK